MGEDDHVDPAIPRRGARVEGDQKPIGVRPAVNEQTPTLGRLDEDRVPLAGIAGHDVDPTVRAAGRGDDRDSDRERESAREGPDRAIRVQRVPALAVRAPGGRAIHARSALPGRPGRPASRPDEPGDPPASRDGEEPGGCDPAERYPGRRRQGQAREGEISRRLDDAGEQADHERARQAEQDGDHGWRAGPDEKPADERQGPRRHRRGHQRHDHEVQDE
jgi:hypothetical protein